MKSLGNKVLKLTIFSEWAAELLTLHRLLQVERASFTNYLANIPELYVAADDHRYRLEEAMWEIRNSLKRIKEGGEVWVEHLPLKDQQLLLEVELDGEFMEEIYLELKRRCPVPLSATTADEIQQIENHLATAEMVVKTVEDQLSLLRWVRPRPELSEGLEKSLRHQSVLLSNLPKFHNVNRQARVFKLIREIQLMEQEIRRVNFNIARDRAHEAAHAAICSESSSPAPTKEEIRLQQEEMRLKRQREFEDSRDLILSNLNDLREFVDGPVGEGYTDRLATLRIPIDLGLKSLHKQVFRRIRTNGQEQGYYKLVAEFQNILIVAERKWSRFTNSQTWWGRLANWLDDRLKTKEPM